jgi:hypothetical protein
VVAVTGDPRISALLKFEPVHPYRKWRGAHWRLLSLVELGVNRHDQEARAGLERVLAWILNPRLTVPVIAGRPRAHASVEGNVLLVSCRLGLGADPRADELARRLVERQWPDGGWNCDIRPGTDHSSFHETLAPLRGLLEHGAHPHPADRAAEFLLRHRLFRSERTGAVANPQWLELHWPAYWHYDVLQGLRAIARAGRLSDPRASEALDWLEMKRLPDGTWRASGRRYWRLRGRATVEVVNWGNASDVLTRQATEVLAAAGRTPSRRKLTR